MSFTPKSLAKNYRDQCRLEGHRNTAVLQSALSQFSKLRDRMLKCGQPTEHKLVGRCRTMGCQVCREKYMFREAAKASDRFAECSNEGMAFATIILGVTCNVGDIERIFAKARSQLRGLIGRRRRAKPKWNGMEVLGWMEVDLVEEDQLHLLGSERAALLHKVGLPGFIGGRPIWVVTFHGIVRLADRLDRYEVAEALAEIWPEHRQVVVKPLHEDKSIAQNVNSLVLYCLKYKCETYLAPIHVRWKPNRIAEFFEAMASWSRGFHRAKISVGPRYAKNTVHGPSIRSPEHLSDTWSEGIDDIDYGDIVDIEPMPFLIG